MSYNGPDNSSFTIPFWWNSDVQGYLGNVSIGGQTFSPVLDTGSGNPIFGVSKAVPQSALTSIQCTSPTSHTSSTGSLTYEDGESVTLNWSVAPVTFGSTTLDVGIGAVPYGKQQSGANAVDVLGLAPSPWKDLSVNFADQVFGVDQIPPYYTFDFTSSQLIVGQEPDDSIEDWVQLTNGGLDYASAGCSAIQPLVLPVQGVYIDGKPFSQPPKQVIFDTGTTGLSPTVSAQSLLDSYQSAGANEIAFDFGSFKLSYSIPYVNSYKMPSSVNAQQTSETWIFGNILMNDPNGTFSYKISIDLAENKIGFS